MRIHIMLTAALLLSAIFAVSPVQADAPRHLSARSGNSSEWPMFRQNEMRTGYTPDSGPGTSNILWSNNTSSVCYSSPAVANGRVYIGSEDSGLYCFNSTTGQRYWRFATGNVVESSPFVDVLADRVYFGSYDSYLYCLNATSGTQVWRTILGGSIESSPVVYNGKVYIGCVVDSSLYAIYASNGTKAWNVPNAGGSASPAIGDGRLFSNGNDRLWCLNVENGSENWNASITSSMYPSPATDGPNVYTSNAAGHVLSFNSSLGTQRWDYPSGYTESLSSPAIHNGSVYICVDGQATPNGALLKLNASTGANQWSYPVNYNVYTSPAVAGDRVYFAYGGTILCLKTSDHSVVWSYIEQAGSFGNGVCSSPAIAYGRCYIGGSLAKVYCFGQAEPNRPPAAVTVSPPYSVRETSMMVCWTQNGDADFARYEVHRSINPAFIPGPQTLATSITSRTTVSYNISGLNYSTRYYVKVRVYDSGDPVMFNDSNEISATTLTPNGAPASVTLYAPTEVTPYSMKLSWSVNGDPDFARYELHKGFAPTFPLGPSTLVQTFSSRDQNSSTVSNLKPGTMYYFRVRVYDNATTPLSNVSNTVSSMTGNIPPAAVVVDPPQMGATSAYLNWSANSDEDFLIYEVHCSRNASFTPGPSTLAGNVSAQNSPEVTIENLVLARTYFFRVRVLDMDFAVNDSNTVNGTTANTVPKPVISSPSEGDQFDTRTVVSFDGANSTDQDLDALAYYWTSSIDGFLSREKSFSTLLTIGSHRVNLFVDDGNGHNISAKVNLNIIKAPDRTPGLWITSHKNNDEVAGLVKFSGTAWDTDGNESLTEVQIKIEKADWKKVTGTTNWTYDWNVSKLANGKQKITFRVFDGELYSPEQSITVAINNINLPPRVTITTGASAPFSKTAAIAGTASDPDGTVQKVELSINDGGWFTVTGTSAWTYSLDVSQMRNGQHNLKVRAFDGQNYSDTASLDFTVKKPTPVINPPTTNYTPFIAIGVVVAVLAVVGVLMMRRKKSPPVAISSSAAPQGPVQPAPQGISPPPAADLYRTPQDYQAPPPQDYQTPPPQNYEAPPPQDYQAPPPQNYEPPPPTDYQAPPPANYQVLPPQDPQQ